MFSGFWEITILAVIVVALFLVPRILRLHAQKAAPSAKPSPASKRGQGLIRLAVLLSMVWIIAAGLVFRPWSGEPMRFATVGLVPVALGWGIRWVVLGFK